MIFIPWLKDIGGINKTQLVEPVAWRNIEFDQCEPWSGHSDVNKPATKMVWGAVIEDKNSGAVHCDIVLDYSTQEVMKML